MNSRRKRILVYLVPCVLLAGAIPALTQQGGGESDHRAEHRVPLPPTATSASGSTRTTSPAGGHRGPDTNARETRLSRPAGQHGRCGARVAAFVPGFLAWSQGRRPPPRSGARPGVPRASALPPGTSPPPNGESTPASFASRCSPGIRRSPSSTSPPTGDVPYELDFYLVHADGRWQISQLATPGVKDTREARMDGRRCRRWRRGLLTGALALLTGPPTALIAVAVVVAGAGACTGAGGAADACLPRRPSPDPLPVASDLPAGRRPVPDPVEILAGIAKQECNLAQDPDPSCTPHPGATGPGRPTTRRLRTNANRHRRRAPAPAGDEYQSLQRYLPGPRAARTTPPPRSPLAALVLIKHKGAPQGAPIDAYLPT